MMEPGSEGLPRPLCCVPLGREARHAGGFFLSAAPTLPRLPLGLQKLLSVKTHKNTLPPDGQSAADAVGSVTDPQFVQKDLCPYTGNLSVTRSNPCPPLGLHHPTGGWTHLLPKTHQELYPSSSLLPA